MQFVSYDSKRKIVKVKINGKEEEVSLSLYYRLLAEKSAARSAQSKTD